MYRPIVFRAPAMFYTVSGPGYLQQLHNKDPAQNTKQPTLDAISGIKEKGGYILTFAHIKVNFIVLV